tara:strand:- start:281 stop:724 length:444 start_codon:yes stop_codon:yes gene_type:complete
MKSMPTDRKNFSYFKKGVSYSEDWTVTLEEVEAFAKLSRDFNPIHLDKDYAKNLGYDKQLVYGFLTAAQFSRILGMHLPGKNCLILEELIAFPSPIYTGDKVRLEVLINSVNATTKTVNMKIKAIKFSENNQNHITVARGKILCKVL